ncbi:hypothetical protein [Nocardioides sp. TF02-7]|uniref:hypothetical protein n=1 Tax=Nocardioides sp. TF02-7 TaxID=2917724 RepID=UPI001F06F3B4|nr:hypothetical protein [Nocardioides sp. TF02-7]UMG94981.1 hypothetical protein MF408_16840 [Nocardioides sp. TF02-7]
MAYLERLRELGVPDRMVEAERDAWILVAARMPDRMPLYMEAKQAGVDDPAQVRLYRDLADVIEWDEDDPRLPAVADRLVATFEAIDPDEWDAGELTMDDDFVDLLDSMFLQAVPAAPRLLRLLEERGWTGWTQMRPVDPSPRTGAVTAE